MQVDGFERRRAHELNTEHHHARNPEEEDVVAGLQHLRRVVARKVWRLVGPAEGAEWPEAAAEPGVEDVALLLQGV